MMSPHPSTSTNSRILNGSEIITGGSIIMPIDMSAAETTMSITRNGTKMTKPMMNAARSSEIMNAGMSVSSGTALTLSGFGRPAARVISAMSSSRVCAAMKPRSGASAACAAAVVVVLTGIVAVTLLARYDDRPAAVLRYALGIALTAPLTATGVVLALVSCGIIAAVLPVFVPLAGASLPLGIAARLIDRRLRTLESGHPNH